KDGVPDRRGQSDNGSLARSRRWLIFPIDQNNLNRRRVAEPRYPVLFEVRIQDLAVLEFDRLEQGAADRHDIRTLDLVLEIIRIEYRAAVPSRNYPQYLYIARRLFDRHFRPSGNVATFFESAADSEPVPRGGLAAPTELLCCRLKYSPQPLVLQVLEPEFQRVHIHSMGQLVHMRLASKVVGCGGEAPIRSLL